MGPCMHTNRYVQLCRFCINSFHLLYKLHFSLVTFQTHSITTLHNLCPVCPVTSCNKSDQAKSDVAEHKKNDPVCHKITYTIFAFSTVENTSLLEQAILHSLQHCSKTSIYIFYLLCSLLPAWCCQLTHRYKLYLYIICL